MGSKITNSSPSQIKRRPYPTWALAICGNAQEGFVKARRGLGKAMGAGFDWVIGMKMNFFAFNGKLEMSWFVEGSGCQSPRINHP
tara:strand:- start:1247 stop:1501 length:255 start_codon:yes stop_codon:yes gene_type:complete